MMKIKSLLNEDQSPNSIRRSMLTSCNPPANSTRSQGPAAFSLSPRAPATPSSGTNVRQKPAKDAAIFQKGLAKEAIYEPYECDSPDRDGVLSTVELQELREKQKQFKIFPAGGDDGKIRDFVRRIPYSSDKKTFHGKTGRAGFECE